MAEDNSDEEEQVPEHFAETLHSHTGWVDLENDPIPLPLSLDNIHNFFVTKRLRRDEVMTSKPFEKATGSIMLRKFTVLKCIT